MKSAMTPLLSNVVAATVCAAAATGTVAGIKRAFTETPQRKIQQFASGKVQRLVLKTVGLNKAELTALMHEPLDKSYNLGAFVDNPNNLVPGPEIHLSRTIVDTTEHVVDAFKKLHPQTKIDSIRAWRSPESDKAAGGSGNGPHVRGEAVDIQVSAPHITPVSLARELAFTAQRLNVRGIAVEQTSEHAFSVHLNPFQKQNWNVEQAWQNEVGPAGDPWQTYWHGNVSGGWSHSYDATINDLSGTWTTVGGRFVHGGSGGNSNNGTTLGFRPVNGTEYATTMLSYVVGGRRGSTTAFTGWSNAKLLDNRNFTFGYHVGICGLCVYYLDHTNKWQLLRPDQVALIMLVSVLLTIREIATIDFPEFGSNAYFKKCVECFLFALLTSLLVALRHG